LGKHLGPPSKRFVGGDGGDGGAFALMETVDQLSLQFRHAGLANDLLQGFFSWLFVAFLVQMDLGDDLSKKKGKRGLDWLRHSPRHAT